MRKYPTYEETKKMFPKNILLELLNSLTYKEIAEQFGCDKRLISKLAQNEYLIPKNFKNVKKHCNDYHSVKIDKEELYELYVEKQYSARKIANIYHVTHDTILKRLKEMKINIRNANDKLYYDGRKKGIC